jgi:integrase
MDQWPSEIAQRWRTYRRSIRHRLRAISLTQAYGQEFSAYVSYHLLSLDERLDQLPPQAKGRLQRRTHADDLEDISGHPVVTTWDDLFTISRVQSFITWQSWRVFPWQTVELPEERPPTRPTQYAVHAVKLLNRMAHDTGHPFRAALQTLSQGLRVSRPTRDKQAPYHRFDLDELEQVAQAIMAEARRMPVDRRARAKGSRRAIRFQIGLMLALAWRNPMRARNWCEARLETHLRRDNGTWHWRFEGDDLKIGVRGGQPNVFEPMIDHDIVPALEEYLRQYRPAIPNAARDDHVFLTERGGRLTKGALLARLQVHVYRYTGKRLYTHLLRSLFSSHHLSNGVDINSVAYGLNDTPKTVLTAYNQLHADKHRGILQEANRRALAHSNGHALTPPALPATPTPPRTAR